MIIKDYRCRDCGTITEHFVDNSDVILVCQQCGGESRSIISGTSFSLEGCSGDFPTAHQQWDKKRAQKQAYEHSQGKTPFGQADY